MKKLKEIRLARGMTQKELAAQIGMTGQTVYYYEAGEREPNLETLRKLATVLDCTIDELIGGTDDDHESEDTAGA